MESQSSVFRQRCPILLSHLPLVLRDVPSHTNIDMLPTFHSLVWAGAQQLMSPAPVVEVLILWLRTDYQTLGYQSLVKEVKQADLEEGPQRPYTISLRNKGRQITLVQSKQICPPLFKNLGSQCPLFINWARKTHKIFQLYFTDGLLLST